MPMGELPVYTGSDPYWHEARGANTSFLDQLVILGFVPHQAAPTEQSLFDEAKKRQGFAARNLPIPEDNLAVGAIGAAHQWQIELLQASDRSIHLGGRLANLHPIDPSQPLDMRTAFHPAFADYSIHIKMPASNYLLQDLTAVKEQVFKPGKKSLSVVEAALPLLNADGESASTIIVVQTKSIMEVEVIDVPCLPKAIAADEDFALLEAFHRLSGDWKQIGACMNGQKRVYMNLLNSWAWKIRHTYRLTQKQAVLGGAELTKEEKSHFTASVAQRPITNSHLSQNTLRGCAPGLVDPYSPSTAMVRDPAGVLVTNWVEYPQFETHPTAKLQKQHAVQEKKILASRSKLIKQQAEQHLYSAQQPDDSDENEGHEGEASNG